MTTLAQSFCICATFSLYKISNASNRENSVVHAARDATKTNDKLELNIM